MRGVADLCTPRSTCSHHAAGAYTWRRRILWARVLPRALPAPQHAAGRQVSHTRFSCRRQWGWLVVWGGWLAGEARCQSFCGSHLFGRHLSHLLLRHAHHLWAEHACHRAGRSQEVVPRTCVFAPVRSKTMATCRGAYAVAAPPLPARSSLTARAACGWTRRLRATRGAWLRPRPAAWALGRVEAKGDGDDPVQRRKQRRKAQEVRVCATQLALSSLPTVDWRKLAGTCSAAA